MIRVVKVGGNQADDAAWVLAVAERIGQVPTVLVHGGGRETSEVQRAFGAEPEWRDGLRVTTPTALRALGMVLSGEVNKRWVGALLDAGVDALGLSGQDGGLLRARVACGGALGRVGEITSVRAELLHLLLDRGFLPVISPVSRGEDGGALNVNADDAAVAVAAALGAAELLFVSDVAGVRSGDGTLVELDAEGAAALIASGEANGGMVPKLQAATRSGIAAVRIGGPEMLTNFQAGTRITC